jgi:hypothetical protein
MLKSVGFAAIGAAALGYFVLQGPGSGGQGSAEEFVALVRRSPGWPTQRSRSIPINAWRRRRAGRFRQPRGDFSAKA